jgi:hypothetical protein
MSGIDSFAKLIGGNIVAITDLIEEIIAISKCVSPDQAASVSIDAREMAAQKLGIKPDTDLHIARAALLEILGAATEDDIRLIHALMYSGRDGGNPQEIMAHFAGQGEGKADLIRTIVEKVNSLALYLRKGQENAKSHGLDILGMR